MEPERIQTIKSSLIPMEKAYLDTIDSQKKN